MFVATGILLGFAMICVFMFFCAVPVLSPTGRYDIFTELVLKCKGSEELEVLRADCIKAAAGHEVGSPSEGDERGEAPTEAKILKDDENSPLVKEDGSEEEASPEMVLSKSEEQQA